MKIDLREESKRNLVTWWEGVIEKEKKRLSGFGLTEIEVIIVIEMVLNNMAYKNWIGPVNDGWDGNAW